MTITLNNIPHHVALIPDGNRRWAKAHNVPTFAGHQKGFESIIEISRCAKKMGIKILTIWAFSTENWNRKPDEVSYLMQLYAMMIDRYLKEALREKIRIVHLGRRDRISKTLCKKIIDAQEQTRHFDAHFLCIALDYGGRDEIVRAIQKLKPTNHTDQKVDEQNFSTYLDTSMIPYPDPELIIRTGGEHRLSGFMLWQSQYAELMFVKKYLPDFTPEDFQQCVLEYTKRERRFGT